MKRTFHLLLAAFTLITAMTFIPSCGKTEPDPVPYTPDPDINIKQEFRLELSTTDTTVFIGHPCVISFSAETNVTAPIFVKDIESRGATAEATISGGTGTLTVVADDEKGKVTLMLGAGALEVKKTVTFSTYHLSVTGQPDGDLLFNGTGDGFSLTVDTNLPDEMLRCHSDASWVSFTRDGSAVEVKLSASNTEDDRTADITIGESEGRLEGLSFSITQEGVLIPVPGMVPFTDRAFKRAAVKAADTDGDGEVSPEEALKVKALVMPGQRIRNLDGLEYFRYLETLDVSDNILTRLWLDDPGSYAFLRNIDARNNPHLTEPNTTLSGCYAGTTYDVRLDGSISLALVRQKEMKPYNSTDYSMEDKHELIHKHSKGRGIPITFAYYGLFDRDYESGAADEVFENDVDELFGIEPIASLKEYFDIYMYSVPARDINYKYYGFIQYLDTFKTEPFQLTIIAMSDIRNTITKRSQATVFGTPDDWSGGSVIECAGARYAFHYTEYNVQNAKAHEFGHAMGRLADQYQGNHGDSNVNSYLSVNDPSPEEVPWSRFFDYPQYEGRVGIYNLETITWEGARNYGKSIYYPSPNSLMGTEKQFDSPSRWAIFRNVLVCSRLTRAFRGTWPSGYWRIPLEFEDGKTYDEVVEEIWPLFLEYDRINDWMPY